MKCIRLFWHKMDGKGNFGDELSPWIIEKLSNQKVKYAPLLELGNSKLYCIKVIIKKIFSFKYNFKQIFDFPEWLDFFNVKVLISIGSIISWHRYSNVVVWGSGIITKNDNIQVLNNFHAVRGYKTIDRLNELGARTPKVVGDPALLLSLIYQPENVKKFKFGIIPHVFHYQSLVNYEVSEEVVVIDLTQEIETVIDLINSCEKIISTSLHGVIVAHTYNIPALWVKFSFINKDLNGDGVKFQDYFSSVCIPFYEEILIDHYDINFLEQLFLERQNHSIPKIDIVENIQQNLLKSAPFVIKYNFKK